ncbi:FMN-dependent alpha-hydroxy acid dehydrogenase [Pseudovirgaria hyperparasitica]|uniref:FMN-dependent alpha-hydroxy acid dehydrogenase n=1 Tax=Pseudovirgaria hyperparasitica TaxID=470096 RepID=A0A6A6WMC3_9PEZI|nr:FMN-dependent alpha-hydroxy acid dehydrogenase [Pseudovirgaria hyperparasitica]KAF2763354.1 FMN-dependent alpha-hydroxy acid dehydrogenase [Pseudovirgaria hyperparasitica]
MFTLIYIIFATAALAARLFLNEPDTGFDPFIPGGGGLTPLNEIFSLADFDASARSYMSLRNYSYYRNGAAGEWSYRNNLEAFGRIRLRPRSLVDITHVEESLPTSILGYNFSAPFFIAPAGRAGYGNPDAEKGLLRAGEAANVLYIPSFGATLPLEDIVAFKSPGNEYTTFQQLYIDNNDTNVQSSLRRIENAGQKAIILTIDSPGDGARSRAERYGVGSADTGLTLLTWERFSKILNMTSLPIVLKGITTVEDARMAVSSGASAIYLSNHGGRQLDFSPSGFEVALEIHKQAPEIFDQIDVWADGGVRYGTDVLKLLALGVKAVGLARPFMYANCYGEDGVARAIDLLRTELINDSANLGLGDIKSINSSYLSLEYMNYNGWYTR